MQHVTVVEVEMDDTLRWATLLESSFGQDECKLQYEQCTTKELRAEHDTLLKLMGLVPVTTFHPE